MKSFETEITIVFSHKNQIFPDFITESNLGLTHGEFVENHPYLDLEPLGFEQDKIEVVTVEKQLKFVEGIDEIPSDSEDMTKRIKKARKNLPYVKFAYEESND